MQNLSGQTIGRYHIIEKLGEGGMAVVYRAYDTTLDCSVAIKILRMDDLPPSSAERTLKRFKREAKETAQLMHPNIIQVTDYGEFEGAPFLVMPFVPGGTLKQKLQELHSPMTFQEAARLLAPIARALESAHRSGVVHRDIKPANILITRDSQPMLSDFGIAKILENDRKTTELTKAGMVIGTPEYMAPEQWLDEEIDGRADIYSLGVVFYEMITGRTPFMADTVAAVMVMVLRDPLPEPGRYVKGLPDLVDQIVYKALARDPKNRYQTMEEFANALERITVYETSKSNVFLPKMPFRKNRKLLFPIGGLFLITILSAAIYLWSKNAKDPSPSIRETSTTAIADAQVISSTEIIPGTILTPETTPSMVGQAAVPDEFHWEFEKDGDLEGWGNDYFNDLNLPIVRDGLLELFSTGSDPYISTPRTLSVDSTINKRINLRMKVSAGYTGQIFFITESDQTYDEAKKNEFQIMGNSNFEDYSIDVSLNEKWKDKIIGIRLDPTDTSDSNIWVDYVRIDPISENNEVPQKKTNATITPLISDNTIKYWQSNGQILTTDKFNNIESINRNWALGGGFQNTGVINGNFVLHGQSESEIPSLKKNLSVSDKIVSITNLKYSPDSNFQYQINAGKQSSTTWRNFGVEVQPDRKIQIFEGKGDQSKIFGFENSNIDMRPNIAYSVMLYIDKSSAAYLKIWETDKPEYFAEYKWWFTEAEKDLEWRIQFFASAGDLELISYEELATD